MRELATRRSATRRCPRRRPRICSPAAPPRCSPPVRCSAGWASCIRWLAPPMTRRRRGRLRAGRRSACQGLPPARDYVDVPTFPAVSIDQAFVVDEDVTHERLEQCMSSAGGKLLAEVRLFDVYRDSERIGEGKKSMGIRADVPRRRSHAYRRRGRQGSREAGEEGRGATGAEVRA